MPQFRDETERQLLSTSQQLVTLSLAPGKSIQVPGYGNRYYCKELYAVSTFAGVADIQIQTDLTSKRPLNIGMGEVVPDGSYFTALTLFNPDTNPTIKIELYAGFGDIIDNRLNIVRERPANVQPVADSPTDVIALPALVALSNLIAAGTTVPLSASPPAGYFQRRGVTIANADPNNPLQLVDGNGDAIGIIFAESTQVYYFSGDGGVKCPGVSDIEAYVGEIWYISPTS